MALLVLPYALNAQAAQAPGTNGGTENQSSTYVSSLQSVPDAPKSLKLAPGAFNQWSCVSYVKSRRPDLSEPWGTPKRYAETHGLTKEPFVGAVGISKEGPVWHAFFVESISSDSMLISEANFIPGVYSTRSLALDSPVIVGFR